MMITVDTNVLISATFWYGNSNKIIEKFENKEVANSFRNYFELLWRFAKKWIII